MERIGHFVAIYEGSDGNYYSAHQWNIGKIPNQGKAELTDLVYDFRTKVIYYVVYNGQRIAFRHPYLSENGKYCRFVDGDFVEIP